MARCAPLVAVVAGLLLSAAAAAEDGEGALLDSIDTALAARAEPVPAWFDPSVLPAAAPAASDGAWDFRLLAWVLVPRVNLEPEVGGGGGHLSSVLGESVLTGARLEAVGTTFGLLLEVEFAGITAEEGSTDYEFDDTHADVGLIWRAVGGSDGEALRLDLFGGARYRDTRQDVGIDDADEWWEPFAGTELRLPFLLGTLVGRFTASGFDAGPTTFAWTASGAIEFSLGPVVLQLGVRYDDVHFASGTGGGYGLDMQQVGFFLGVGLDF